MTLPVVSCKCISGAGHAVTAAGFGGDASPQWVQGLSLKALKILSYRTLKISLSENIFISTLTDNLLDKNIKNHQNIVKPIESIETNRGIRKQISKRGERYI